MIYHAMHKITSSIFYVKIKILAVNETMMNKDFQASSNFLFKENEKNKMNFPEFFIACI